FYCLSLHDALPIFVTFKAGLIASVPGSFHPKRCTLSFEVNVACNRCPVHTSRLARCDIDGGKVVALYIRSYGIHLVRTCAIHVHAVNCYSCPLIYEELT